MELKDRIKHQRLSLNMTLEEVASKVGISRSTIHKYESGLILNIPSEKIEKLAKVLETSPEYLMGWDEEHNTEELIKLKTYGSVIDLIRIAGIGIIPVSFGTCDIRNESKDDELPVGCNDKLCIDCPLYVESYELTMNNKEKIISFDEYRKLESELISFVKFKLSELINEEDH
jgi:transcriptional regulator with XRE-family HTH domain